MFDKVKFSKQVKFKREFSFASVRGAAKKIGISAATLCRIENGAAPDIDSFVKICQWAGWEKKCDFFFVKNPADLDEF